MADHKLFQDEKTGKLVEFISKHDKEIPFERENGVFSYIPAVYVGDHAGTLIPQVSVF